MCWVSNGRRKECSDLVTSLHKTVRNTFGFKRYYGQPLSDMQRSLDRAVGVAAQKMQHAIKQLKKLQQSRRNGHWPREVWWGELDSTLLVWIRTASISPLIFNQLVVPKILQEFHHIRGDKSTVKIQWEEESWQPYKWRAGQHFAEEVFVEQRSTGNEWMCTLASWGVYLI